MKLSRLAWSGLCLVSAAAIGCGAAPPAPITLVIAAPAPSEPPPPPPPRPPPVLAVAVDPLLPTVDEVRDGRFRRRPPRATPLLVVEVQALETLLASTDRASPDRPKLLFRIALSYAELTRAAQRDREQARDPDLRARADKLITKASGKAIDDYQLLAREHPTWCVGPGTVASTRGTGCNDEVLYYLGLEAERAGQSDVARHSYLELVQSAPQSRLVPAAYLAFGEMFLAEAAGDPSKLTLAEQAYAKSAELPSDGAIGALARYRLAQVYAKQGDDGRALAQLVQAAAAAREHPEAAGIAAAVRRDAVIVYARSGDPDKTRQFFAKITSSAEELETAMDAAMAELSRRRGRP
jgi:predicted negative regulator of RcsB-dependent stress response